MRNIRKSGKSVIQYAAFVSNLGFRKGVKREMWSHDEQKEINDSYAVMARITCKYCGAIVHKYVESHYTGGSKCVILAKYCRFCGNALNN